MGDRVVDLQRVCSLELHDTFFLKDLRILYGLTYQQGQVEISTDSRKLYTGNGQGGDTGNGQCGTELLREHPSGKGLE